MHDFRKDVVVCRLQLISVVGYNNHHYCNVCFSSLISLHFVIVHNFTHFYTSCCRVTLNSSVISIILLLVKSYLTRHYWLLQVSNEIKTPFVFHNLKLIRFENDFVK